MFNFDKTTHATAINKIITDLLEKLDEQQDEPKEFEATALNLAKLMEFKNQIIKTGNESVKIENDHTKNQEDLTLEEHKVNLEARKVALEEDKFNADQEKLRSWKPSPDAIIGAVASVAGIVLVLHYEKLGVVTSKALGFVGKMK